MEDRLGLFHTSLVHKEVHQHFLALWQQVVVQGATGVVFHTLVNQEVLGEGHHLVTHQDTVQQAEEVRDLQDSLEGEVRFIRAVQQLLDKEILEELEELVH